MHTFTFEYHDAKENDKIKTEEVAAENALEAFQKFIEKRGRENWSIPEIFTKSKIRIIDADTGAEYRLNPYGEIKQSEIRM
ncbi:MAG: hypothetical protein GF372_02000 [Candidatus Marinimicrobia bacterium]|nr:hypothetical protein [Candidatus Neomarinimicrobiota bacterium]